MTKDAHTQTEDELWEEICEMFVELSGATDYEHCNDIDQDCSPNEDNPHTEGCMRRDANGIHYLSIAPVWTKSSTRRRWRQESEE